MTNTPFVARALQAAEDVVTLLRDMCGRNPPNRALLEARIEQQVALLAVLELYQPYDYKPARNWQDLEKAWLEAPASYARTQALAVLLIIQHTLNP